jgi:hypothetical protein
LPKVLFSHVPVVSIQLQSTLQWSKWNLT